MSFNNGTTHYYCPPPLLFRNSTNREKDIENGYIFVGETLCVLSCPSPLYTVKEWDTFYIMSIAMGTICMLASLILIITYSPIINKKFNKTSIAILSMAVSIFLMSSTDGYQIWDVDMGFRKYCPEKGRYARQSDASCFATGVLFQYGSVSSILWWSVLSFDLWMSLKKKKTSKRQILYYFIGINIVSIIFTLAPIHQNQYAYNTAAIGCWLSDLKYQLAFFFIPLAVVLTFGSVFIVLILYEIYKLSNIVEKKQLKKYIRPSILIILMCLEFYYMVIYYSSITSDESNVEKRLVKYIICLFENENNPKGSYTCNFKTLSAPAQFIFLFSYRIMGLEALIFYGFTTQTKKIWKNSYLFTILMGKPSYQQTNAPTTGNWGSQISSKGNNSLNTSLGDTITNELIQLSEFKTSTNDTITNDSTSTNNSTNNLIEQDISNNLNNTDISDNNDTSDNNNDSVDNEEINIRP